MVMLTTGKHPSSCVEREALATAGGASLANRHSISEHPDSI
jgi:hypothetical protein